MPRITTRTLKRRQAKTRLESRLAEVEAQRSESNAELLRSVDERQRIHLALADCTRKLQTARRDSDDARAELAWIAAFAIAKVIGAPRTFSSSVLNSEPLYDQAMTCAEPRRG